MGRACVERVRGVGVFGGCVGSVCGEGACAGLCVGTVRVGRMGGGLESDGRERGGWGRGVDGRVGRRVTGTWGGGEAVASPPGNNLGCATGPLLRFLLDAEDLLSDSAWPRLGLTGTGCATGPLLSFLLDAEDLLSDSAWPRLGPTGITWSGHPPSGGTWPLTAGGMPRRRSGMTPWRPAQALG